METVWLDLYEVDLYGAESPKSLEIVEEYIKHNKKASGVSKNSF